MPVSSPRTDRSGHAATRSATGDLLYGAVVCGATLAALSDHATASTRVAVSTLVVLVAYWLAHVYVRVLSTQLDGSDARKLPRRLADAGGNEVGVLVGGLPALTVYVTCLLFGVSPANAGTIALFFLVGLLFGLGFLGARRAGFTGGAVLLEAVGAGCFGVAIVIMKAVLH